VAKRTSALDERREGYCHQQATATTEKHFTLSATSYIRFKLLLCDSLSSFSLLLAAHLFLILLFSFHSRFLSLVCLSPSPLAHPPDPPTDDDDDDDSLLLQHRDAPDLFDIGLTGKLRVDVDHRALMNIPRLRVYSQLCTHTKLLLAAEKDRQGNREIEGGIY
jgi:hypothetical protein